MIQLRCPACKRVMSVDDSKAGKVGRCLQCNQKFRVPGDITVETADTPPQSSARAARESASRIPKEPRPLEPMPPRNDEAMSDGGYGLEEIPPRSLSAKRPRLVDEDIDNEGEQVRGPDDRGRPRSRRLKKRERRQHGVGPQIQDILPALGFAGAICATLVIVAFWIHEISYLLLIIGVLVVAAGRRMILHLAMEEGTGVWLACLVVPFYPTYFFFTRISETYKAFLVSCAGYLFLVSGGALWLIFFVLGASHRKDVKNLADHAVSPSMLTLLVEGKEVRIPIDELIYNSVKRGRESFPDFFEMEGKGVNLFGEFWVGFNQEWRDAIDKPARITARDAREHQGDSHVELPGKGDMKVVRGELIVKQVQDNEDAADPFVRGTIELELKGPGQNQSLKVRGTFEAQVHSFY
jgi:hypothetical protein